MRYSVNYPNTYDAQKLAEHQHPVSSQNGPVPEPYYPVYPFVDESPLVGEAPPNEGFSVYTYDTRPPSGVDILFTPIVVFVPDLGFSVFSSYRVPDGYNLIVRKMVMESFPDVTQSVISPLGAGPGEIGQITVDDLPVQGYDQINLDPSYTGMLELDCFIPVREGSRLSINAAVPIGVGTRRTTFYGNLLLSTGRAINLEYTEQFPVPVDVKSTATVTTGTP